MSLFDTTPPPLTEGPLADHLGQEQILGPGKPFRAELEGSVHVPNGKFLRAITGSIFRLPYLEDQSRPAVLANKLKLYSLTAKALISVSQADLPTVQVESLTAGVACSIAVFEAARQRGKI